MSDDPMSSQPGVERRTAREVRADHRVLLSFSDADLAAMPLVPEGTRLARGGWYLDLGVSSRAMRRAVVGALRGEPAYSLAVLSDRIRIDLGTAASRGARTLELTPRQREVVALIATGASDKEIGTALGIATATAQKHVTHLLKRLDVPNRAAAVAATLIST